MAAVLQMLAPLAPSGPTDAAGDGQATIVPFPCSPAEDCGLGYPVTCCQEIHKPANLPH